MTKNEYQVDAVRRGPFTGIDPRTVANRARRILSLLDLGPCELSLVLCDDGFIHHLNREFRGKDKPTDVLSFPLAEEAGDGVRLLGDVIISVDTATRQAKKRKHALRVEVTILLIHGILHLLGYTHENDDDEAEMEHVAARLRAAFS